MHLLPVLVLGLGLGLGQTGLLPQARGITGCQAQAPAAAAAAAAVVTVVVVVGLIPMARLPMPAHPPTATLAQGTGTAAGIGAVTVGMAVEGATGAGIVRAGGRRPCKAGAGMPHHRQPPRPMRVDQGPPPAVHPTEPPLVLHMAHRPRISSPMDRTAHRQSLPRRRTGPRTSRGPQVLILNMAVRRVKLVAGTTRRRAPGIRGGAKADNCCWEPFAGKNHVVCGVQPTCNCRELTVALLGITSLLP